MKVRIMVTVVLVVGLLGCAAAGVPYTNEPWKKLAYAFQLMKSEGRALPAEKLGLQALSDFEKDQNWYGIAEAEYFLGTFYRSPAYRSYEDYYSKYNEYDPTGQKAILHYQKSIAAFTKDDDYWGVAKSTFEIGITYLRDSDVENACISANEALSTYKSDKNIFKGRVHPHNPRFESFDAIIEAFIQDNCHKSI